MSDPIAAAEAAGKARDIANRFETAVFLIAYSIAEKDGLYEADPHRYPYSQAFRHGMNILAALCAECSDDAEELLPTFNESDFIRNSAASDVREWTARWRDECREAVEGCRSIEIGPLASVDGDYFAATSECYEVLRFAENDLLGGHQERRVYEFLRTGTQFARHRYLDPGDRVEGLQLRQRQGAGELPLLRPTGHEKRCRHRVLPPPT